MKLPLLLPLTLVGGLTASAQTFRADLSGHQQVPSASSPAEGSVALRLINDTLYVSGSVQDLTSPIATAIAGGAHVHIGPTGANGPVVLPLRITQDERTGNETFYAATFADTAYAIPADLLPELRAAMRAGRAYVNVHTLNFMGGETRGQVIRTDNGLTAAYDAMLYSDQQNPPVLSDGMGGVLIEVREDSMFVSGAFALDYPLAPIGGTGAHLHIGGIGQNGPINLGITPTVAEDSLGGEFMRADNGFAVNTELVAAMRARDVYVNIHSAAHPGGEIRGQVVPASSNVYLAYVSYDAPQPYPNVASVMRIMVDQPFGQDSVVVSGSYREWSTFALRGLTPYIALRNPFNSQGLEVLALTDERDPLGSNGRIPATAFAATDDTDLGLYYRFGARAGWVNGSRSSAYRGRFYHECKRAFHSRMTASQTVPDAYSSGSGEITTEYYTDRIEVTGGITGLSGPIDPTVQGGFHIHTGMVGRAGPILLPINYITESTDNGAAILPSRNLFRIEPDTARMMRERGLYYNVHTSEYPMGEIRGQIVPRANVLMHTVLETGQTVPETGPAPAHGALLVEMFAQRGIATGTFDEVFGGFAPSIGGGAHLHVNLAGRSGPIRLPLVSQAAEGATAGEFMAEDNDVTLPSSLVDTMLLRRVYANIHSTERPSGELRGQLGPLASNVAHAKLSNAVTVPNTATTGMGHLHFESFADTLTISGSWDSLATAINPSVAGGAHVHLGRVAEAGSILFGMAFAVSDDSTSADVDPRVNTGLRTSNELDSLFSAALYANIHTRNAPSGAIRGQVLRVHNQYPERSAGFSTPMDGDSLDLDAEQDSTMSVEIAWQESSDPDPEQSVAYLWQLFADTTAAPVLQTAVADSTQVSFTYAQLDSLLASLGLGRGETTTVYHRAVTTDGSLLTPSTAAAVTLKRRGMPPVSTTELPTTSARLVSNLVRAGSPLTLELDALPAGQLNYRIVAMTGERLSGAPIAYVGGRQRVSLDAVTLGAGMYVLELADGLGRTRSWIFSTFR